MEYLDRVNAWLACAEFNIKNTQETLFSLGSNSKQFTAFSIMQLMDKGEIILHESADKYLPKELWVDSRITVHHLLSHSSDLIKWHMCLQNKKLLSKNAYDAFFR